MLLLLVLVTFAGTATINADDVEIGLRTPELIKYWGYPEESIKATTQDGYVLTMHRIPHGKYNADPKKKRPVVLIMHGLEVSSSNFVANLPNKALGFMLADAGYDVWLGNFRGDLYSIEHKTLDVKSHEFWQFTWYHMYKYDITAMVNKALQITNQTQLYYVGHSQGTLAMFAKLSKEPQFAKKIRKYFALAPVVSVKNIKGFMGVVARDFYFAIEVLYKWFGSDQFTPDNAFMQTIEKLLCKNSVTVGICDNFLFLIAGPESNQLNTTRVPVYITDLPSGSSTLNVLHWIQMVRSGKFEAYDYGSDEKNMEHYGVPKPEVYDLRKITTEMYLYYSDEDWLADQKDVEESLLPNLNTAAVKAKIHLHDFNHLDYIWGERAAAEIYKPIIEVLNKDIH